MRSLFILIIIAFFVSNTSAQKFDNLAKTPPMVGIAGISLGAM